MAFRKKAGYILAYTPDILIVQECECPEKLIFNIDVPSPKDVLWFGDNKHKGLAIFSFSEFRFSLIGGHNQDLKLIIPVSVKGGGFDFYLFAIWANNPTDIDGQYVEQIWKAIHHYDDLLSEKSCILIGDFNSNSIWDRKRRSGNHSNVVKYLEERAIFSSYHLFNNQVQGNEQHPTLYLYRHKNKPYHIDYCFLSSDMAEKISAVHVGDYDFWKKYSDHVPLMVTLNTT